MNMVKTLDKQITISHAQRADAPQGKIFKLQEYQKTANTLTDAVREMNSNHCHSLPQSPAQI